MADATDMKYFQRRQDQERRCAAQARTVAARDVHTALADHYAGKIEMRACFSPADDDHRAMIVSRSPTSPDRYGDTAR